MSSQQRGITLEEALEQLNILEAQIKQLQGTLAEIEARIAQLSAAEDALADLRKGSDDTLVPLDPRGSVLVRAQVKPVEKAIIHAGMNIFIETSYEKVLEFLREEKAELSKLAEAYRAELARLTEYYSALRSAVEQAISAAAQQGGGRS